MTNEYTAKGTLKRNPDDPKKQLPASPEERAARLAEAKAKAAAAAAARAAGGGAPTRPVSSTAGAAPTEPEPTLGGGETVVSPAPSDGALRTAKGTLKRNPDDPKKQLPATPEEKAARLAAAKSAAAAAKAARAAGGGAAAQAGATGGASAAPAGGAVVARGGGGGESDAQRAERRRIFDIITAPLPGAEPVLRPVVAGRAERGAARAEFPLSERARETIALFRRVTGVTCEELSSPTDPVVVVDRADLTRALRAVRDHAALQMNFLRCVSGVDHMDEGIEVVYHLKSLTTKHGLAVKTMLPPHDPTVDSVTPLWPGANWHERELMEMFGVRCVGHPDPRNLLLDEDMTIHPLLKAHPLQELELKQGVNVM